MNTVKVAVLRNETDRLFRLANVHYHACVGIAEVEGWKTSATRALGESSQLVCKRASAYDQEQYAQAIAALTQRVADAAVRIAQLQREALQDRPSLRIVTLDGNRIH